MKEYIETLHGEIIMNGYGDAIGSDPPTMGELSDKLNEVIRYLNRMIDAGIFPLPEDYKEEQ